MVKQSLDEFIRELVNSLEGYIIQQPSMSHVIHSLAEMQKLFHEEAEWFKKILTQQLSQRDFNKLQRLGYRFKSEYQLSLHDVFDLIEIARDFCLSNLRYTDLDTDPNTLLETVQHIKNHFAHGYFKASLETYTSHFKNGFTDPNPALSIHRDWLIQLEQHFLNPDKSEAPMMDHSRCSFAHWLETLEAKQILHASGDGSFDLKGHILLTHRTIHDQANFILSYLNQQRYAKALIHLEEFKRAFLLLDKYINRAHFNYLRNPYTYFLDFVLFENRYQHKLDYYFVIHYGLIKQSELYYKEKQEVLSAFTQRFLEALHQKNLDFISLLHDDKLHVVLNKKGLNNFDQIQPVKQALKSTQEQFGSAAIEPLHINLFHMNDLPACQAQNFSHMLNKISLEKCKDNLCEIGQKELLQYRQEVMQDIELLEVVQTHLVNKSFELHYQPIVNESGQCKTVETLIRMPVEKEIIEAEKFLQVVEAHQLTLEIDRVVFELVKKDIPDLAKVTPMINVNIYPQSLSDAAFISQIIELGQLCQQHDLQLMVEITEHEVLLHDAVLVELHQNYPVMFAIDDFGTGYSNLAKLAELATSGVVQVAKLDGDLIKGIDQDSSKLKVVKFVTDMAANLGLQPVIAEFVDSQEKLKALSELPSQILYQGFYFARPMPLKTQLKNTPRNIFRSHDGFLRKPQRHREYMSSPGSTG